MLKSAFVTGATGFLGLNLIEALLARALPLREMVSDCVGWLAAEGRLAG